MFSVDVAVVVAAAVVAYCQWPICKSNTPRRRREVQLKEPPTKELHSRSMDALAIQASPLLQLRSDSQQHDVDLLNHGSGW